MIKHYYIFILLSLLYVTRHVSDCFRGPQRIKNHRINELYSSIASSSINIRIADNSDISRVAKFLSESMYADMPIGQKIELARFVVIIVLLNYYYIVGIILFNFYYCYNVIIVFVIIFL